VLLDRMWIKVGGTDRFCPYEVGRSHVVLTWLSTVVDPIIMCTSRQLFVELIV
jgi:hypothetical protein